MNRLPLTNDALNNIGKIMDQQDKFGLKKYGVPLNPMDDYDWIHMAEQEAADMIKYFYCERLRRDKILRNVLISLNDLRRIVDDHGHNLLDLIENDLRLLSKNI